MVLVTSPANPETPLEKVPPVQQFPALEMSPTDTAMRRNPLRGKSLGFFGPENRLRKGLCEVLIHPVTEPIILILIIFQTVLLAVEAAPSVYDHPRLDKDGISKVDYALLVLFILYTIEVIARTIVSGFIWNPYEYSTLNRSIGPEKSNLRTRPFPFRITQAHS